MPRVDRVRPKYSQDNKEDGMDFEVVKRKPGRPKAVPDTFIPKVVSLYEQGLGYRAVARELREEGISPNWSTIRRIIKTYKKSG